MARKHKYPDRLVKLFDTLYEALSACANDEPEEFREQYYEWLPGNVYVTREKFMRGSFLINGLAFYGTPGSSRAGDLEWRIVWAPFFPENFKVQVATGTETRNVWDWRKLRRIPTEFATFETIHPWDEYDPGWGRHTVPLEHAVDSYHEWKSKRLAVAS